MADEADRIPLEQWVHASRTAGKGWRVKWTSPPNADRGWYRTEYRWFPTWGTATTFARRLRRRLLNREGQ